MPDLQNLLEFFCGAGLLFIGAEYLIEGSKILAIRNRIPKIIIGITLVAFGTSLPELIVSILANLRGEPGLVLGNVIGSNIANIGLVLGIVTIIKIFPIQLFINMITQIINSKQMVQINNIISYHSCIEIFGKFWNK